VTGKVKAKTEAKVKVKESLKRPNGNIKE